MIPKIGEKYNHYDDGKVRPSRHLAVEIIDVIPFNETDTKLQMLIEEEQKNCDWLYADTTDYIVIAKETKNPGLTQIYIRTKDGGWFSIDTPDRRLSCGRLDVTHEATDEMVKLLSKGYYDYTPEVIKEILNDIV